MVVKNTKAVLLLILLVVQIAGCTKYIEDDNRKYLGTDIFKVKGEYETEGSFQRRKASINSSERFFEKLDSESCVHKNGFEHICYRIASDEEYLVYSNGVSLTRGKWKRHNNAICIDISCKPTLLFKIRPFSEYQAEYPASKPDPLKKSIEQLKKERIELTVRSIACYKCSEDIWRTSDQNIFEQNCTVELNAHKLNHGKLGISNIFVDTVESQNRVLFTAATDLADGTKGIYASLTASQSEICNPQFELKKGGKN